MSEPTQPPPQDVISIPAGLRDFLVRDTWLSPVLIDVLERNGFERLGDLIGLRVSSFRRLSDIGPSRLAELDQLVRCVATGVEPSPLNKPGPGPPPKGIFVVPPPAHDLIPFELPISLRLQRALLEVLQLHLGATEPPLTLSAISSRAGISGSRVGELFAQAVTQIARWAGARVREQFSVARVGRARHIQGLLSRGRVRQARTRFGPVGLLLCHLCSSQDRARPVPGAGASPGRQTSIASPRGIISE